MSGRLRSQLRFVVALIDGLPYSYLARRKAYRPEELVADVAARSPRPFTFVQIGSNDGRSGDPLFATVIANEVRGLLVEPVPELYESLIENYAGKAGLSFVQVAVSDREGPRAFYVVKPQQSDPVWVDQLGSFSRDVILAHVHEVDQLAERVLIQTVYCRTLESLAEEFELKRIDFLHIDAEGHDLDILNTVDFAASWAPRFILYEQKHLGIHARSAVALMNQCGYHTLSLGPDVFAFRGLKARCEHAVRRLRLLCGK